GIRDRNVTGVQTCALPISKNRAVKRLTDPSVSRYPLPWLATYARNMRDMFAGDPFPFGIEPNRATFEQFLRYTHEQGIAHRHAKIGRASCRERVVLPHAPP